MTYANDLLFTTALEFTLKWEGGTGHPQDLAGPVNRGISQNTYDTYRRNQGLSVQSVSLLTDAELEDIYYHAYWKRAKADLMCLPLSIVHFDTAVNFHVPGSIEFLQEAIGGLTIDGKFGPNTQRALDKYNNLETAKRYCHSRIAYRHQRVKANPSQEIFLEGWLRRDRDLLSYIEQLGQGAIATSPSPVTPPQPPTPAKSEAKSEEVLQKLQQAIALLQDVVDTLKTTG
jgi:lysozyme family protein